MSYLRKIEYRIIPEKSYEVIHKCSGCGSKTHFINTGRFRVNANGNKLDVWLIYQCEICKHTLNLSIYERTDRKRIPKEEYALFLENDEALAQIYGMNVSFFGRNRVEVDWNNMTYRVERLQEGDCEVKESGYRLGDAIMIYNPHGIKMRPEKIVGQILDVSRSMVKKLMDMQKIVVEQKGNDWKIVFAVGE